MTSAVDELSDRYVERVAALDPVAATFEGIPGYDAELTDYSPDGIAERLDHARTTLRELDAVAPADDGDRVAAEILRRHLTTGIALSEIDDDLRPLRVIGSPVSDVRICFDLMPRDTVADWETVVARVAAVPHSLDTLEATLRAGIAAGVVSAERQAVACARQADTWGGANGTTAPVLPRARRRARRVRARNPGAARPARRRRRPRDGGVRRARPIPDRDVRAEVDHEGRGRRGTLRVVVPVVHRHEPRSARDL